ncbi:uncharacterized protein LOC110465281 [Mizuhopecten yessoensis]|uniref:uncharacterized protein LOC110465281 n=1 Tax=Mizuhopecten yessoensis TaxID=6573 RepID=UPI000B457D43|nr:uncharacterized protein LOC110465281 [Mizuhopecten yessoensis]
MASGGGLAVIPNDAVNEEIKKTHNSKIETAHSSYGGSHNVWLGVNDICTEGVYETFEGVNATYLSWMSGQPNDKSLPGDLQDCTIARLSDSLDWHDKDSLNCLCSSVTKPRNETVPLDQITEKIKKEMLIDVKTTSAYKRSLVCAEDPRPSSQYIGATAASMMVVIGCAIILPDLGKVVMAIVKFFSN